MECFPFVASENGKGARKGEMEVEKLLQHKAGLYEQWSWLQFFYPPPY